MKPPECKYQAAQTLIKYQEKEGSDVCPFTRVYCKLDCPLYNNHRSCTEVAKRLMVAKKFELI